MILVSCGPYRTSIELASLLHKYSLAYYRPQFKRLASFQGDWMWQAPRRYTLKTISQTQDAWSYSMWHPYVPCMHVSLRTTVSVVYKRGSQIPYLGAAHGTDILEFFTSIDNVAVDAMSTPSCTLVIQRKFSPSFPYSFLHE